MPSRTGDASALSSSLAASSGGSVIVPVPFVGRVPVPVVHVVGVPLVRDCHVAALVAMLVAVALVRHVRRHVALVDVVAVHAVDVAVVRVVGVVVVRDGDVAAALAVRVLMAGVDRVLCRVRHESLLRRSG
jgi:hypothetical protein